MNDTSKIIIENILTKQREFFAGNQTRDISFRIEQLKKFKSAIKIFEKSIADALWTDLHKSFEEAYITEISIVNQDIDYHIRHLKKWSKPKRVPTPLHLLPSSSKIIYEPLGVSLIVALELSFSIADERVGRVYFCRKLRHSETFTIQRKYGKGDGRTDKRNIRFGIYRYCTRR